MVRRKNRKLKDLPKRLYTSACLLFDNNADDPQYIAGPYYYEFPDHILEEYGDKLVADYEYDVHENSDGESEKYFYIYVERGD